MKYIAFSEFSDIVFTYVNDELLGKIGYDGSRNNLLKYVQSVSPDKIKKENGVIFVSEELTASKYCKEYLKKRDYDYSANDIAHLSLSYIGTPPKDEMSINSLEKMIRKVIIANTDYKKKAYIKFKRNEVICVDQNTASNIVLHPDIVNLKEKQIKKAELNHKDTPEWRAYEEEKNWIMNQEAFRGDNDDCDDYDDYDYFVDLSNDEELYIMVKAIFTQLFSEFDIKKYNSLHNEWIFLDSIQDFGERFQKLRKIFNAPNYNNEFYKFEPKDEFLDLLTDKLADKIANKVLKRIEKNKS